MVKEIQGVSTMNDDMLRVQCKQCKKIMFNIEFDLHKCMGMNNE